MAKTKNTLKTTIILIALGGTFFLAGKYAIPSQARQQSVLNTVSAQPQQNVPLSVEGSTGITPQTYWLSPYEGGAVRVTFVIVPPDLEKIFTFRLVKAEQTGLVLRFGNKRTLFFPYSNIISVEPM